MTEPHFSETYPDRIANCFANRTLLITGASGFVGKVLLEKVLRCCTDVHTIYVILRPKYGVGVKERLEQILQSPIFASFKETSVFRKVKPIVGDMSKEQLGLSIEDTRLLQANVEIVYHCAANCRFDERLADAVLQNVRGTRDMLVLAKGMPRLLVFVHISTAYCHPHEDVIDEQTYQPPDDPRTIIRICEQTPSEILSAMTHKILDAIPNTYTYTKALAEGLINAEIENLPVLLLRPSFIIPIWKDPLPGWTNSINGMMGFEIAAGKGILRTMHTNPNVYLDFLPVDVAVASFLFNVFEYITYQKQLPLAERCAVRNLTTSSEIQVTWREIKDVGLRVINERVPLNWPIWYPGTLLIPYAWLHNLLAIVLHYIPALGIDVFLLAMGFGLLPIHRRLTKGFVMMAYYCGKQWQFRNEWSLQARRMLNPHERRIYTLYAEGFDLMDYFTTCVLAARRYILHESDATITTARRFIKFMLFLDWSVKLTIVYYLYQSLLPNLLYNIA